MRWTWLCIALLACNPNDAVERDCAERQAYFPDSDGDGIGEPTDMVLACEQPEGYVENSDDCNDRLPELSRCPPGTRCTSMQRCLPEAECAELATLPGARAPPHAFRNHAPLPLRAS